METHEGRARTSAAIWQQTMRAVVLSILLGLSFNVAATRPGSAETAQPRYHIYLIRGLFNVFSLGMDEIAAKLQQQGIQSTVHNHLEWPVLAEQAAADYKSGRVRTIIIVGHSAGAAAVTSMANRLGELGVPVKLAIGLDPVWETEASGHVGRYVNYYISDGAGRAVERTRQFHGALDNVDVKRIQNIGHFNIDKNQMLQRQVIRQIRAALYSGPVNSARQTHSARMPEPARQSTRIQGSVAARSN